MLAEKSNPQNPCKYKNFGDFLVVRLAGVEWEF